MKYSIAILLIILCPLASYSLDLGNNINLTEYPTPEMVMPVEKIDSNTIISGSIEKNIEINLNNCIWIALGNNPQIRAAFQDILASDERIKQVWSNFFPSFSWQTSYTHLKQLQLSDAFSWTSYLTANVIRFWSNTKSSNNSKNELSSI